MYRCDCSDRLPPYGGLTSGVHLGGARGDLRLRIGRTTTLCFSDRCGEAPESIIVINYILRCSHFLASGGELIVNAVMGIVGLRRKIAFIDSSTIAYTSAIAFQNAIGVVEASFVVPSVRDLLASLGVIIDDQRNY